MNDGLLRSLRREGIREATAGPPRGHPAQPGPLFIRIPPWVEPREMEVKGVTGTPRLNNGYMLIPRPAVDLPISLTFPLRQQEITLEHRTRQIRTHLRGDEVIAMENFKADLTFFDPLLQVQEEEHVLPPVPGNRGCLR